MGKWRRGNRVDATGRSRTDRFVRLPHRLLNSNAYRSLSPNARALLVELVMLYNGDNNGSLYLSVRDAAARMGIADLTTASRAFDELIGLAFIEMTQDAHFRVKAAEASRARCWQLTWEAGPGRKLPSWAFLEREPEPQSTPRKRMERGLRALKAFRKARDQGRLPVLDSDTISPFRLDLPAAPVLDCNTPMHENDSFPPKGLVRDSATHIATPWGVGVAGSLTGWWQPDWTTLPAQLAFAASLASSRPIQTAQPRAAA
jgi:hypothetical protein